MGLDQEYEMKELKERRKLQMRNKAVKKGIQRPSVVPTLPRYTCSPNTRDVQTPEHTVRERSCMKEEPRSSEQRCWSRCGRTNTESGPRDPRSGCPSGLVRDLARSPETPRHLRVRRVVPRLRPKRMNTMKRKRSMTRRRKSKNTSKEQKYKNIPYISLLPLTNFQIKSVVISR